MKNLQPERVFFYFEEISKIPRGSGNMKEISNYCENFAKKLGLEYKKDEFGNVVIFKPASCGYENSDPVMLQGHLDMVCIKEKDCDTDFEKDGIKTYIDGDFIKAKGTTLGADNGIAVAVIFAVLEDKTLLHPPIEAVFTVDEEVGMLGALKLDMSMFKAKKMINLDSEEEGIVMVSCAGGEDFSAILPAKKEKKSGTKITVGLKGLKGGHSGVEINSGRVNAAMLCGRVLSTLKKSCDFDVISISGGDKSNAIPDSCLLEVCTNDPSGFVNEAEKCFEVLKKEFAFREPNFAPEAQKGENGEFYVFDGEAQKKLVFALLCAPCGVVEMSSEIEGLVETSLNLGILKTDEKGVEFKFSLRSNKKSAQSFLKMRLETIFCALGCECKSSGYYPPWEFKDNSRLQKTYSAVYEKICKKTPEIAAIHAGLECGVFSSASENLECISVGPEMFDVHTVFERLNISSVQRFFEVIKKVLEELK